MTKRETILRTGQKLFAKYGPQKTTVEDVIRLAQVAKGTFYNHFSDKDALFLEVVEAEARDFLDALEEAIGEMQNTRDKFRAFYVTAAQKAREMQNYSGIIPEMFPRIEPQLEAFRERLLASERNVIRRILEEGVRKNEVYVEDIDRAAYVLILGVGIQRLDAVWMFEQSPVDLEDAVEMLVEMLMGGLERD